MSEARPDLHEAAVADRELHPWRYYKFEWPDAKRWLDKLAAQVAEARADLAALRAERDEFKRIGQQFERDMRKHFEQGCINLQRAEAAEAQLRTVERRIWQARQEAFARWKEGATTDYDKGLREGVLFDLDHVLSIFRDVIDGTPGSGAAQMAKQKARCEATNGR